MASGRLVTVILVTAVKGQGTSDDPCRRVHTLCATDGTWLATYDPLLDDGSFSTAYAALERQETAK